jgi:mannan endo-1,4-beta-mannosidase
MRIPRPAYAVGAIVALLGAGMIALASTAEAFAATPKATVINYLKSISGTSIVSG